MYTAKKSVLITQKLPNNHIKPSTALALCQELADEHAKVLGLSNAQIDSEIAWILNRQAIVMSNSPCFGNEVEIDTFTCPARGVTYPRQYVIRQDGTELARVTSDWSIISLSDRKIMRAGEIVGYDLSCKAVPMSDMLALPKERAKPLGEMELVDRFVVRRNHIDQLGHMNNTCYFDLVIDMISDNDAERGIDMINITYISEALLGEEVSIFSQKSENEQLLQGVKKDGTNCFVVRIRFNQRELSKNIEQHP